MTFVLACCIVAVFFLGTIQLWRTTRAMRKLEVMDEEKRARIQEMRHCGINIWHSDEIPFGVRALQTGVEVDGIWVLRPYHPESSQIASSATLMGDHSDDPKGKAKYSDTSSNVKLKKRHPSEDSTIDTVVHAESHMHPSSEFVSKPLDTPHAAPRACKTIEHPREPGTVKIWSYLPTGWQTPDQLNALHPEPFSAIWSSPTEPAVATNSLATPRTTVVSGTAKIHASKLTRKPKKNFEVRPAGTLCLQPDTINTDEARSCEATRLPHFQPGPSILRKKKEARSGHDN